MSDTGGRMGKVKQVARREALSFARIFAYFYICLGVMVIYRTAILHSVGASVFPFGFALVKALVLAKVIMLAHGVRLGERYDNLPAIYPTLYASVVFFVLLVVMSLVEEAVRGFWNGVALADILSGIGGGSLVQAVAGSLFMFVVLVNYFAFRQIARRLGEGRLFAMFFRPGDESRAAG